MKSTRAALALVLMTTAGCSAYMGGGASGEVSGNAGVSGQASVPRLNAACRGDFGTNEAARKVTTFLNATATFLDSAAELQQTLQDTCGRMANDLQIPANELPGDLQGNCDRVARAIREEMTAVRGGSGVTMQVVATPPVCRVSVDAYAQCAARCDASYTPGQVQLQCEGGELRGRCEGQCTGRCAVDVQGACNGVCDGECEGTMEGGRCNGTCRGRCEVSGQAQCNAECRGGCSIAYREPYCTGHVVPPQVTAECRAACDAHFSANATCTPGRAELVVTGNPAAELAARSTRLRAAIHDGLATIRMASQKLQLLTQSGRVMVQLAPSIPAAAGSLGLQAAACATQAVAAFPRAMASVNVSVQVSVSVSGSVN